MLRVALVSADQDGADAQLDARGLDGVVHVLAARGYAEPSPITRGAGPSSRKASSCGSSVGVTGGVHGKPQKTNDAGSSATGARKTSGQSPSPSPSAPSRAREKKGSAGAGI